MSWLVIAGVMGCLLLGELRWMRAQDAPEAADRAGAVPAPAADSLEFFGAQIAPLLARHCLECHDSATKKGKLDLSRKETALTGGKNGAVIVAGKPEESLLWKSVESGEMPEDRPPLSDEEKQVLKRWIEAGAAWSPGQISPLALERDHRAVLAWPRRLTVAEYIETVRSAVGVDIEQDAGRLLPADQRADGFSNTAYNLNIDLQHVEAYAELAEIIAERVDVKAFTTEHAGERALDDGPIAELINGVGKWLLRGPLDEHEIVAYQRVATAVAEEGGDRQEIAAYVMEAMLQSPRFIYRIERQRGDGTARRVGDYELASRLSYIIWGGPPDKELMRAADAGELSDPQRVAPQVERMLRDRRAVSRSLQFVHEWLNLDRLSNLRPSKERFPNWNEQLAADMRQETLAFFEEIAWKQNRPLSDLLNAQFTFVTPRLAAHYGLPRAPGAPAAAPTTVARVTQGLQALYAFKENGGETVGDVSGTGEPLHLKIADPAAVQWSEQGLYVDRSTLIASANPPGRLIDAVRSSKEITLEAWITPANAAQAGPARIVTLSADINSRNFTLGQAGDFFETRFRTTTTSGNGQPSLSSPPGTAGASKTHVVYTRGAGNNTAFYVNGQQSAAGRVDGDLSNWDGGFRLALANEFSGDRPWQGTLHLVAVYDRALSPDQVRQNHAAGRGANDGDAPDGAVAGMASYEGERRRDLQALYRFDEGGGDTIRDTSGAGDGLDLKIEDTSVVQWDSAGLAVKGSTRIATHGPPRRLIEAIKASGAMTVEAYITPDNASQSGPARIVTLSSGISERNFTLGQDGDKYDFRFRTSTKDANGLPSISSPGGTAQPKLTHVVYTRSENGMGLLYINGKEEAGRDVDGNLSNWDDGFELLLGNESTKERPWQGTLHTVAIYSRALTPEEIRDTGRGLVRYDLTSVPSRGGLLTQGSVLTIGGDNASMVTRGLFILHDFLHSTVGSAPPGVDTTPVPPTPGLSHRGIAEGRLANESCSGCHSKFEPLAFGLEKFDGIGAYHERDEHGNTLREDGEILFPGEREPAPYKTAAELMDLLAGSERVSMSITRKVTQFALGRPLVESDSPELEKIHRAAEEGGGTYASLITAIVMSDLVQMTRTERPQ